jgi:2,3-dihydroxy-p-cumate/2,3-dihydroxybenzoate 3,4-dioxygenase
VIRYSRLAYVALTVTDLERSRAFYQQTVGLRFEGRSPGGEAVLRASAEQQVFLHAGGKPGLKRLGWQMESAQQLDSLAAGLARHGVPVIETRTLEGHRSLRITEPNTGGALDFFARPPGAAAPDSGGAVELLGHAVLRTPRYAEAVEFFTGVLGFRASDEIAGRITFLRCFPNPLHHSIGIAASPRNMLHHVNFLVRGTGEIDAAAGRLRLSGVPIVRGPGHHPPSGSTFLYFLDPDGLTLEYSHGMERFPEVAPRAPRVLPPLQASPDLDAGPRDPRMYAVGEIETEPAGR